MELYKPLTLVFSGVRTAQTPFFLTLSPPPTQPHVPFLGCPQLPSLTLCWAPGPTHSQDQGSENPFTLVGGGQWPLLPHCCLFLLTLPIPPPTNHLWKSSKLLLLCSWYYPLGRNVEPGRWSWNKLPGGLGDRCGEQAIKSGCGDQVLGSLQERVNILRGHY